LLTSEQFGVQLFAFVFKRGIKQGSARHIWRARFSTVIPMVPVNVLSPLNLFMKNKVKPIHEVRIGFIKAAIWKNETEAGVRYNVTFSRLYKDVEQWKSTESFGRDDLLLLAKVADNAHSWICAQSQEEERATNGAASRESDED